MSMTDFLKQSLINQFHAALSMFQDAVEQCPDEHWESDVGRFPFWHVAYHTLFYVDLYLSPTLEAYKRPSFHREELRQFGRRPEAPENITSEEPFDKETILGYIEHCRVKAIETISAETEESLQGPSGFWWYKIPRLEFCLNNIRHLQHHASQMSVRLRRLADVHVEWIGSGFKQAD